MKSETIKEIFLPSSISWSGPEATCTSSPPTVYSEVCVRVCGRGGEVGGGGDSLWRRSSGILIWWVWGRTLVEMCS